VVPKKADTLKLSEDEFRHLGYRIIDLIAAHLENPGSIGSSPHRQEMDAAFDEPPPHQASDPNLVLDRLIDKMLPATLAPDHRRFFAFVPGPSNGVAALAEALSAGFNIMGATWLTSAASTEIELITIDWIRSLVGMPETASGLFVPGGSVANLIALGVARDQLPDNSRGVVYGSNQTHACVWKACKTLGLRPDQLRIVPTNSDFTIDISQLEYYMARDRHDGYTPMAIVGNAGTTNTAAVDNFYALAELRDKYSTWLHVDGSYGAAAILDDKARHVLDGIDAVDSITLDPHKWWFQPYECSIALLRNSNLMTRTYTIRPEYLEAIETESIEPNLCDRGIQLSRSSAAIKLWMTIETFGLDAMSAAVRHGIEAAEHAQECVEKLPDWEVVTQAQLGVLTFCLPGDEEAMLDAIQYVNDTHQAYLAPTQLNGRKVVRMCCINPRTDFSDIEFVINTLDSRVHSHKLAG
jgi:aromatic-L-amino-acid/L-tryptophan decarboxylase